MQQVVDGHLEVDHAIETLVELVHQVVQRLGLRNRPWEAIHDEAGRAVRLAEAVADDADHDRVRDVLPRGEDGLGLSSELRAGLDLRPEHIAGRDVGDPEMLAQHVGLRALAAARCSVEK